MGYSNTWNQHENFSEEEWAKIKLFYHGLKLVHGGGALIEADHIIDDQTESGSHIKFNGTNGQDYETFTLKQYATIVSPETTRFGDPTFNFCKTNRNPYDAIVWAVLSYARYVKGNRDNFTIRNDDAEFYGSYKCKECGHHAQ